MARSRLQPDTDPTGRYGTPELYGAPPTVGPEPVVEPSAEEKEEKKQKPVLTIDWRGWLQDWGFPSDVVSELDRIFRVAPAEQAPNLALAYIRGTKWYDQTFPGIKEAMRLGLVADERDYRSLLNAQNQLYRQHYDRDITTDEFAGYLREGVGPQTVGRRLEGEAFVGANRGDIQYLSGAFGGGRLGESDLTALGRQQAGLGSLLGADLMRRIGLAEQRLRRVFEGQLATPSLSLGPAGLSAPSLDRDAGRPDIGR